MPSSRSGAQILVDTLANQGITTAFGVPGESYLSVLDALRDSPVRFVTCRQEGGAAMMAEATGKLTNRPGICFVTRGPGATNASAGVHVAMQDSTPMILFIGQVERGFQEREAFQEMNYRAFFSSMAKWVVEINDAARIPELVTRAFRVALQGRPGPVVIALPEDMLVEQVDVEDTLSFEAVQSYPSESAMATLGVMLEKAERPLILAGGSSWTSQNVAQLAHAASHLGLPVATSFRRQALFPNDHPCYAGHLGIGANPKLLAAFREADLIVLLGGRLSEMPSQSYSLLGIPNAGVPLVHIHADAEELGRVYQPDLAIQSTPQGFMPAFEKLCLGLEKRFTVYTEALNASERVWSAIAPEHPGAIQMGSVMATLRDTLPDNAILCSGAGNYAGWLHRFHRFRQWGTQLAPTSGSMGYGVPAAIAAKHLHPDTPVIAFAGDGCFLMHGQELATAVQYNLPITVIVVDNGMYGTIRMHQEKHYPHRTSGTDLQNPDFAALAKAYGGFGATVNNTEDFAPALAEAQKSGKPALIHILLDKEAITPTATLSSLRP